MRAGYHQPGAAGEAQADGTLDGMVCSDTDPQIVAIDDQDPVVRGIPQALGERAVSSGFCPNRRPYEKERKSSRFQ
jgi:hypothetical protein